MLLANQIFKGAVTSNEKLTCMKFAAVIRFVLPSTSFQHATFFSGMFHNLSLPSRLPERKNWSFLG